MKRFTCLQLISFFLKLLFFIIFINFKQKYDEIHWIDYFWTILVKKRNFHCWIFWWEKNKQSNKYIPFLTIKNPMKISVEIHSFKKIQRFWFLLFFVSKHPFRDKTQSLQKWCYIKQMSFLCYIKQRGVGRGVTPWGCSSHSHQIAVISK